MDASSDCIAPVLGGDRPENGLENNQAHDTDILSNEGVIPHARSREERQKAPRQVGAIDNEEGTGSDKPQKSSEAALTDHSPVKDRTTCKAETEEVPDQNIVDWDSPGDLQNPLNWPAAKKWSNIAIISFLSLLTPLTSTMFAPGIPQVVRDLNATNPSLATFLVSIFILGFAVGPLALAPLSEIYGRVLVCNACNVVFTVSTVACALSTNIGMLLGFRFLAGCSGVASLTNGGGSIADLTVPEKRGAAMAIWAVGPLIGPMIGPVAGGFVSETIGWRWIFGILSIAIGITTIVYLLVSCETYAPVLLERKAKRLRRETEQPHLLSKLDLGLTPKGHWKRALVRPTKLMFLSPICALMCIYLALMYGVLYLLFSTFTFVFEQKYGFSESIAGTVYVSVGIGSLISVAICSQSDRIMKHLANKHNDGNLKPEYRLPILIYSGPVFSCGLFIYGWAAQYTVHWTVPLLGFLFVGFGITSAFMCVNTYLVDTYDRYSASAIAAATILRSIFGAVFPLFGLQMYDALGLGWGNTLLGILCVLLCPMPIFFYFFGERIRKSARFQVTL
ncbi:hypothetical protein MMC17_009451 [Xylographa soralifera]|nr:hypothetical protein [Xylographa soralifera]